jgi:hypothetical protein
MKKGILLVISSCVGDTTIGFRILIRKYTENAYQNYRTPFNIRSVISHSIDFDYHAFQISKIETHIKLSIFFLKNLSNNEGVLNIELKFSEICIVGKFVAQ